MQLSAEIVAEVARTPALAEPFGANQRQLIEALATVIAEAQQTGEIAPAIAPLPLAQLVLDVIESQAGGRRSLRRLRRRRPRRCGCWNSCSTGIPSRGGYAAH